MTDKPKLGRPRKHFPIARPGPPVGSRVRLSDGEMATVTTFRTGWPTSNTDYVTVRRDSDPNRKNSATVIRFYRADWPNVEIIDEQDF